MTEVQAETVRVNTRVSKTLNEWLDNRSDETGMSKSTIIMLAVEMYMQQTVALQKVDQLSKLTQEIDMLKKVVSQMEKEKITE